LVAASATAPSLAVWLQYSTFRSVPCGYRGQGRHRIPERLLRDAACTHAVWQKYSTLPSLPRGYRRQGRHWSLNGFFETPPVPVLSGRSTQPFLRCLAEELACSFAARWLQRAGSPLVPERLLRDAACTRSVSFFT